MRSVLLLLVVLATSAGAIRVQAQPARPVEEITQLAELLLHARYDEAVAAAGALLSRRDLSASQRNQVLESKAIAEVALGLDEEAAETLGQLYARDPAHRLSDADASPQVKAAFARVRASQPDSVPVRLRHQSPGALANRDSPLVTVEFVAGADAVEEVRLFYRYGGETRFDTTLMRRVDERTVQGRIPLLAERSEAYAIEYFVEALAPSRTPLARLGSRREPFRLVVPEEAVAAAPVHLGTEPSPEPVPSRDEGGGVLEEWWFWTLVAVAVGGGIASYVLLGPPSEGPQEGTLGTATLSLGWGP